MDPQAMLQALAALDDASLISVITQTMTSRPELAPGVVNGAVPNLTYAPADSLTKRRAKGKITPLAPNTAMGFIDCPELRAVFGADVYVHKNQVGGYPVGTEVDFAILLSKDMKPQAFDLQPTGAVAGAAAGCGTAACCGGLGGKGKGGGAMMSSLGGIDYGMGAIGGGCPTGGGDAWSSGNAWGGDAWAGGMAGAGGKGKGDDGKGKAGLTGDSKPDVQQILGQYVGQIKSFNGKNGFGFIFCEALQKQGYTQDVYLHHNQIGEFQPGQMVSFTAYLNKKGQPQSMD
eukprot:TRINITY_DN78396_c0_g1_i1.p1 TRINITY_DN78396_c0_g1~~TRINITY_DN78396_c0_g1_i1.p1  ORF type:complete len:320 (+),score=65.14 TRINITY_DN78396_c0_g1_i1:97-960(+)